MRVVVIVQARMDSTRLPGKVLKRVLGKPLLGYMVERLRQLKNADDIVIATTTKMSDQAIVDYCHLLGVSVYRGSDTDVLSRYYEAASERNAEAIVRLTADCPVHDPTVIDNMIEYFELAQPDLDYLSNTVSRTFPRGFDCEVFAMELLEKAYKEATLYFEREHVTPYMYLRFNTFRIGNYFSTLGKYDQFRLTVDTEEDFEALKLLMTELYPKNPNFGVADCIEFLKAHPEIAKINSDVIQKKF